MTLQYSTIAAYYSIITESESESWCVVLCCNAPENETEPQTAGYFDVAIISAHRYRYTVEYKFKDDESDTLAATCRSRTNNDGPGPERKPYTLKVP